MTTTLVATLVVTLVATLVVRNLVTRVKAVDVPKDGRRMHGHPIPRIGGLVIFLGFLFGVLLFLDLNARTWGVLLGTVIIVMLGIFNDIYSLQVMFRLVVQTIAALAAVLSGNVTGTLSNPGVFSVGPYWDLGVLAVSTTVIWIMTIVNTVNLIGGLGGLTCGVSTISSIALLAVALMISEDNMTILMVTLAGGCIGFLPYSMNPAKTFTEDMGSTSLDYVLMVVSIQGLLKFYAVIFFATPFLILGLPVFNTCFAFIHRIAHGRSPMHTDHSHVHHRLIDMGFNQKQVVAILYAINTILGLSVMVLTISGPAKTILPLLILCFAGATSARILLGANGKKNDGEKSGEKGERKQDRCAS